MGSLEVVACVVIAGILIIVLLIGLDWFKSLFSRKSNKWVVKQKTFLLIERRYVSYYGLCGIKTDRRKFLLREKTEYRDFTHVREFDIPEGYIAIHGSETVCGEIRSS